MNNHTLAYKMRPKTIDEVVGQQHLLGTGKIVRRMVNAKRLTSMILYGPPGIGKTSIASALSGSTGLRFEHFNASKDDKTRLKIFATQARITGKPTILLLDEIHRLTKDKQDYLLSFLESGDLIIVGATTENPYISVTPAIRSRCQIFELKPVQPADICLALERALHDKENGLGNYQVTITHDDLLWLASNTNGDVRSALNSLELAVLSTPKNKDGKIDVTRKVLEECAQRKSMAGDKNGDNHYDVISAFQKSIRGSDTDAALHYLAQILETGDLEIAIRRLVVIAFEDIGIANPEAGVYTMAAVKSAQLTGLPEARIPLAAATVYLSLSPKSNTTYMGINRAIDDLKSGNDLSIPSDLRGASYQGAKNLNRGLNYKYAHDYDKDWVPQQYLPDSLKDKKYLSFNTNSDIEKRLGHKYEALKKLQADSLSKNKPWPKKE